jgi:hypothetical protein
MFKDFNIPLENVYKLFETYAKIDWWKTDWTEVHLIRHADATSQDHDAELTEDGIKMLNSEETREKIVRLNPDIIIHTPLLRSKQTA